uniref:hypothetical protein n=1 Tax=Fulvivirga sp. TaxID=1931237 RepID=UPI00404998F2
MRLQYSCCGLQHTVAAAHDCQEGGGHLEEVLFVPARVEVFELTQGVERAQT